MTEGRTKSRGAANDYGEGSRGGPWLEPLVIDGLWNLALGGGAKSNPDTLYFTAGPNGETDGLFGTITPGVRR
jgi:hypothetical protein